MSLVVDCSFIMSSILPQETSQPIQYSRYKIYVPSIFYLECSNVLLSAVRRKTITDVQQQEYLEVLRDLPINIDQFPSTSESLYFVTKLAKLHNLSSYDASYLELAMRINAKLATFDKSIIRACEINQIEVVN